MTAPENHESSEIHTVFQLDYEDPRLPVATFGPYFSLTEAIQVTELIAFWFDCGTVRCPTIGIDEYLIREYGLEFIRRASEINLE